MISEPLTENISQINFYKQPEPSGWVCYMFGNRPRATGIVYKPSVGRVPNRFVRWMMLVCFDCLWVKEAL